ncbi:branched-chain amino acid ABC transporter substrate-binding protein [Paraburkholderia nemoris]|uniref:Leucine-, isoleucine-, valine-, threonine-, and alanine-binding protein n=1 Tax=Paraburkholderia nemoris TaxID=2793076 RepID=A0ABM8RDQ3_9BURK|nr:MULTISPECIES: branched-chain amino acid ABC transporter substrate-binding protein [Paraburkholderia]MBK5148163.1 branched-chain amino acid ABC transporter substrate-binding protein [Burkholderia sp. R-69608]MBK3742360.1 branched-chain amino acid ABC transporter substrate-binding protein [Paraburkholderia aspalathi]MBK3811167.1 branched-chain amino acid ABC transporter substrate-binding protein [Paraburkholderia aspalathi]CAE6747551.1 Leucine-, isoleucine-, valine-, threonine-, and alanine-bi
MDGIKTSALFAALLSTICMTAQAEVVKVGVAGPLTGGQSNFGKDDERGVRLAVEDLNRKPMIINGQAVTFAVVSEDDAADPKTGVSVAQKLVDSGVKAVIGHYNSGVTIPASRIYNDAHIPMITGAASNPAVTQQNFPYVFRLAASDNVMGARMAEYAANVLHAKRAAVIDDRTAYGSGVADVFVATAKKNGLEIVGREYSNDKATDFNAILTHIKAERPDVIFYGGYYAQAASIGRQTKQLGLEIPILGGDGICSVDMPKLAAGSLDGRGYCAQGGAPLATLQGGADFASRYEEKFGAKNDIYSPAFYSATMVVAQAIKAANSTDPEKFVPLLKQTQFSTLVGRVAFDKTGEWIDAPVTVYKVSGDALNPIR